MTGQTSILIVTCDIHNFLTVTSDADTSPSRAKQMPLNKALPLPPPLNQVNGLKRNWLVCFMMQYPGLGKQVAYTI